MGGRIHALAQQLTGKSTIEECSLEEVQHIANRHPYFAPAQFLLLQKLRQTGATEEAEKQYQKAVLFFHDPLQFEHFISSDKFLVENEVFVPVINEPEADDQPLAPVEEQAILTPVIDEPAETTFEEVPEQVEPTVENTQGETVEEFVPYQPEKIEEVEHHSMNDDVTAEVGINAEPVAEVVATTDEENVPEPIAFVSTQTPAATDLAFEPFHTVDYFASQGIKISQEELPKDKLGKQLKSFTEWLKTMKRLPAVQIEQSVETSAEKKVESMASHSVTESNVVTEAMAEVWLKQGNKDKALDIYNKLSLLNPSKKAYFAAKIENLKLS